MGKTQKILHRLGVFYKIKKTNRNGNICVLNQLRFRHV